jgi:hypothetical protein
MKRNLKSVADGSSSDEPTRKRSRFSSRGEGEEDGGVSSELDASILGTQDEQSCLVKTLVSDGE